MGVCPLQGCPGTAELGSQVPGPGSQVGLQSPVPAPTGGPPRTPGSPWGGPQLGEDTLLSAEHAGGGCEVSVLSGLPRGQGQGLRAVEPTHSRGIKPGCPGVPVAEPVVDKPWGTGLQTRADATPASPRTCARWEAVARLDWERFLPKSSVSH